MTCAKKIVTCFLVAPNGVVYAGRNDCAAPQETCPRTFGEGYEKCKSICKQEGHAEEMALKRAGVNAKGCRAYIQGIGHYCKECQIMLFRKGITSLQLAPKEWVYSEGS